MSESAMGRPVGSGAWSVLSSVLSGGAACGEAGAAESVVADLLGFFARVPDHRRARWVEHPLAAVLALCAGAVVAGMCSFTAVAGWVGDVPGDLLASMYARCGAATARAPSKGTLWRVLTGVAAGPVDAAVAAWLASRAAAACPPDGHGEQGRGPGQDESGVVVAVDGKTVRGAKAADGTQVHLLAAVTHQQGLVLAQTDVAAKTNEIPMFSVLLDGLDLSGAVVTADALHTQRAHADYLHARGADFVFTVKNNQPRLFDALDILPWNTVPIGHTTTGRGHGRIEQRTIQVLPAPEDLPFPHVRQVFLIERHVTDLAGTSLSEVAALGVSSLPAIRADPARLAGIVRGQWGIESLHWIRDVVYREDASTAHTRSGPRTMAALRNLAIGAHRLAGRNDTAEASRWAGRVIYRPFQILGLT